MTLNLDNLNENQRIAIGWNEGALLVLAGPGSGKTRVLTMRVARLLLDSPGSRFRVLGLTFTNKAASEMRTRVEEMIPDCRERVLLTTFHSFCAEILRQHGSHVGIRPDFTILNQDADREAVLTDAIAVVAKTDIDANNDDVRLLPSIDRLLSNCIAVNQVPRHVKDQEFARKLAALYAEYQRQLIANNRLDFSSLLLLTHRLLTARPAIAEQLRTVYPSVCVDEFQDTNLAQYQVLKAVVGDTPKDLFVVADDDQIIYQWNGASPDRLQALRTDFKMQVLQLPANYRCPAEVIVLANRLIRHNLDRAADKQPLYAIKQPASKTVVRIRHFNTLDSELQWIASDIRTAHLSEPSSCAILARTRKVLEAAVTKLQGAGVAASLTVRKAEFTSAPFRYLHAVLRLANSRTDRDQLRRLCKAFYEIEGIDLRVADVVASAPQFSGDYLRSWFESVKTRTAIDPSTQAFLDRGIQLLVERMDFLTLIQEAFTWFDAKNTQLDGRNEEGFTDFNDEKTIWKELQARTFDKYGREDLTLNILLQEFDLSEKSPPIPTNAVRCLTIHSAKGMEFGHVYLVGLAEDQLPSFQAIKKGDTSREMQEERRNCFVAITRAQLTLTLTYSDEYFGWSKQPSRFLREMEVNLPPVQTSK
ncbi:MAG: ATP-dependent helicase [Phycisphaerales bacterium]|nr:ATP-dependent helicase [Phycisphaerales bacterium]